jgi:TRAP-type C4-dicarboxylate transport system permease small subunit
MKLGQRLIFVVLTSTIIVMFVSVGLGVGSRYIIGRPLFWTEELARFALIWMTFLGSAALLAKTDGHIRFDLLQGYFGARMNAALGIVCNVIIVAMLGIILIGSVLMIQTSTKHLSPALSIPMPYVYAVIPLSALIGIAITFRGLLRQLHTLRTPS